MVDFFSPAVLLNIFFLQGFIVDNVLILFAAKRAKILGSNNEAFFQIFYRKYTKKFF